MMGAPEGNSFWKARSTYGREKLFENKKRAYGMQLANTLIG